MRHQGNAVVLVAILLSLIFVFGFICGVLAYAAKAEKGRYECEQSLPRNQQCVVKWIPEEKK